MMVISKAVRTLVVFVCILVFVTLWQLPLHRPQSFSPPSFHAHDLTAKVDWSRFAYTQYVTNTDYLCNSVMLFETLHRLGSKAERFMMYPAGFVTTGDSVEAKLLRKARDEYGVKLTPIEVQSRSTADSKQHTSHLYCLTC